MRTILSLFLIYYLGWVAFFTTVNHTFEKQKAPLAAENDFEEVQCISLSEIVFTKWLAENNEDTDPRISLFASSKTASAQYSPYNFLQDLIPENFPKKHILVLHNNLPPPLILM